MPLELYSKPSYTSIIKSDNFVSTASTAAWKRNRVAEDFVNVFPEQSTPETIRVLRDESLLLQDGKLG